MLLIKEEWEGMQVLTPAEKPCLKWTWCFRDTKELLQRLRLAFCKCQRLDFVVCPSSMEGTCEKVLELAGRKGGRRNEGE